MNFLRAFLVVFLVFYQSDDTHHMLRNPYRKSKELITEEKVDWSDHDVSTALYSYLTRCVVYYGSGILKDL